MSNNFPPSTPPEQPTPPPPAYPTQQDPAMAAPAYQADPNQQPPAYQPAPAQKKTNTLAIVSLVGSFFVSLVGIICGHIALKQIKRTGEGGRGLALAGTIIGYVGLVIGLIAVVIAIVSSLMFSAAVVGAATATPEVLEEIEQELQDFDDDSMITEEPSSSFEIKDQSELPAGYTVDFCRVLVDITENFDDASFLADLAAFSSPNQGVYSQMNDFMVDPTSDTSGGAIVNDFQQAITDDLTACVKM
ncbi:MAG: DUF4190 domain-containing protein [Leucobacter sp.]|nr:DUF4190 domain-containing protein [Leucobacter sp.]